MLSQRPSGVFMSDATRAGATVTESGAYVTHVATALSAERLSPYLHAANGNSLRRFDSTSGTLPSREHSTRRSASWKWCSATR